MNNLVNITGHLKKKLKNTPGAHPEKEALTLIAANDNAYFIKDGSGNYWRMFLFLDKTKSYDVVQNEMQAFEGGKAFGRIQSMLSRHGYRAGY